MQTNIAENSADNLDGSDATFPTRPSPSKTISQSRFVSIAVASLVLFHSLVLADWPQQGDSVVRPQWPESLPRSSQISDHLRGFPFVAGAAKSWSGNLFFPQYIAVTYPGMIANLLLTLFSTISTYFVFELFRRWNYKLRISLGSLFVVLTAVAILLALFANGEMWDEAVLPKLGLMRCSRFPYHHSSFFYGIGVCCSGLLVSRFMVNGLSLMHDRFESSLPGDGE